MRRRRGVTVAVAVAVAGFAAVAACKLDKRAAADTTAGAVDAGVTPRFVVPATAPAGGTSFDVDPASGRPRVSLVLRLDYFPAVVPGAATLPACAGPLAPGFALGVVACLNPAGSALPLTAGQVEQDCYTGLATPRTPAVAPLTLPGCQQGAVALNAFQPALQLDVEAAMVN